jgi:hypothetical protein
VRKARRAVLEHFEGNRHAPMVRVRTWGKFSLLASAGIRDRTACRPRAAVKRCEEMFLEKVDRYFISIEDQPLLAFHTNGEIE